MSNGFSNFINTQTGEVVYLPTHYAELFPNELELTDKEVECVDCNTPDAPEVADEAEATVEPFSAPTEVALTEPAKRTRRNRAND